MNNPFDKFIENRTFLTAEDLLRGASIVEPPHDEISGYTVMGRTHAICGIHHPCNHPEYRKARTQELLDIVNL